MYTGPDYPSYSDTELLEAFESIDRDAFSERFDDLCDIMVLRGLLNKTSTGFELTDKALAPHDGSDSQDKVPGYTERSPVPQYDENGQYIPNEIPAMTRLFNIIVSFGIIAYGSYGLYINELYVPMRRGASMTLSGTPAVVMFLAIVCATTMMATEVIDHYDKRDNEHSYYDIARKARIGASALFFIAIIASIFTGR